MRELLRQRPRPTVVPGIYARGRANIGNLKGLAYREAMRHVYAGCHAVLRPGGLLVIVLRPGRDRHCLRPLHHGTARICQELGFDFIDEIAAVFGRVVAVPGNDVQLFPHGHFWRRLAIARLREQGWPVTLEQIEYVLVFRKPDAATGDRAQTKSGLATALVGSSLRRQKGGRVDSLREAGA